MEGSQLIHRSGPLYMKLLLTISLALAQWNPIINVPLFITRFHIFNIKSRLSASDLYMCIGLVYLLIYLCCICIYEPYMIPLTQHTMLRVNSDTEVYILFIMESKVCIYLLFVLKCLLYILCINVWRE